MGSGKSTGSIAYKSNVTHSIEPTCAQVQRQQQALLLLATVMKVDIGMMLTELLVAVKENPAECGKFSITSECAVRRKTIHWRSGSLPRRRASQPWQLYLCLDIAYGKIQRMVAKPILLLPLGARPLRPDHVARST